MIPEKNRHKRNKEALRMQMDVGMKGYSVDKQILRRHYRSPSPPIFYLPPIIACECGTRMFTSPVAITLSL